MAAHLCRSRYLSGRRDFRLLRVHESVSMRPLDWVVLALHFDLDRGVRAVSRARQQYGRPLPARRKDDAVVRHGAVDHGDAGERHHVPFDDGAIVRRWHAVRAVLFRPADRDDRDLRDGGAGIPSRQGLYGVRVSGEALRREDARAGEHHLPVSARPFGGAHDLRAGDRALGDSRMCRSGSRRR